MRKLFILFSLLIITACINTALDNSKESISLNQDAVSKVLYYARIIDLNKSMHEYCVALHPKEITQIRNNNQHFTTFYDNLSKFMGNFPKSSLDESISLDQCKKFTDGYSRIVESFKDEENTEISEILNLSKHLSELNDLELEELLSL